MFDKCPGAADIRTPTIIIKKCPECGREVEIFSNEMQTKCCVGEEAYKKLKKKRIAFVCLGNTARSQMAEALARKLSNSPNIEFVSMGTRPAGEVDAKTLEVLREENITWHGKPKGVQDKEPIDVVVTMGCDAACPAIPDAKRIDWDIPDPNGKDMEGYRETLSIIKEKVTELLKEV